MTKYVEGGIELPCDAYRWNKAHRGAFKKGMRARIAGQPKSACPYEDFRKPSGLLSWSRSFITAWGEGWDWAGKITTPKSVDTDK